MATHSWYYLSPEMVILATCTTAVEQRDITMTTDLPTAATDLIKLFSDITDYFLSSPVEYAWTSHI